VDRAVGAAHPAEHAGTLGAGQVLVTPLAELAPQGTRVSSLHVGYMDTDLARHVTEPKSDTADIARIALDGMEAGETEIVADEISKQVLAGLSAGVRGLYPQVA
jgi:NAD(P)-dependent dehydrogenase (short-subunit alcohol dehydrogenase family)